jgi:hypothetical protein
MYNAINQRNKIFLFRNQLYIFTHNKNSSRVYGYSEIREELKN